jgi:hypothetical protein
VTEAVIVPNVLAANAVVEIWPILITLAMTNVYSRRWVPHTGRV